MRGDGFFPLYDSKLKQLPCNLRYMADMHACEVSDCLNGRSLACSADDNYTKKYAEMLGANGSRFVRRKPRSNALNGCYEEGLIA